MKELTSANVDAVAKEVLNGDTNSPNFKKVPMIAHTFGFDMTKLEEHRQDVKDMLSQLPKTFFHETGGGWSFLQACVSVRMEFNGPISTSRWRSCLLWASLLTWFRL